MSPEVLIRQVDEMVANLEKRELFPGARLNMFDRTIPPIVRDAIAWERFGAADAERVRQVMFEYRRKLEDATMRK